MLPEPLQIDLCGLPDREAWDAFVAVSPGATIGHQFHWQTVIKRAYGHGSYYLMARRGSRVVGLLPLIIVNRPIGGAALVSMPFLDEGGVCAEDDEAARSLLDRARAVMREMRCSVLELRNRLPSASLGVFRQDKVTMQLDLSPGADRIWTALPAKVRNQVRKAEKSGLTTLAGGGELVGAFYDVFVVNMRDLGSPVHDKRFFEELCAVFGSAVRIMIVQDGVRTVGGLIAIHFKDRMCVPWASSLREYFPKCPNNLLYWDAIHDACKRGCAIFDFGRSTVGSGTYDFKKQWGARPVPLSWQVLKARGVFDATISSNDPAYRLAGKVWRRLPVGVTRLIGPQLRKYLTN